MWVIVETPVTSDVGNNTVSHSTNAFDTRCTTLLMAFLIPQSYLQSLNSRTLSLFTTAAQNLHQWSECRAKFFDQNDVWTNPVNDAMHGSRGGDRVRTPAPWKITNSIGLYRNMQFSSFVIAAAEHTFIFFILRGFESHQCFHVFFFILIVSYFYMCPLSIIGKQF